MGEQGDGRKETEKKTKKERSQKPIAKIAGL